jgi:hypothetical protein
MSAVPPITRLIRSRMVGRSRADGRQICDASDEELVHQEGPSQRELVHRLSPLSVSATCCHLRKIGSPSAMTMHHRRQAGLPSKEGRGVWSTAHGRLSWLLLGRWRSVDQHIVDYRTAGPSPLWAGRDSEGRSGSKGGEGPARGGNRRPPRKMSLLFHPTTPGLPAATISKMALKPLRPSCEGRSGSLPYSTLSALAQPFAPIYNLKCPAPSLGMISDGVANYCSATLSVPSKTHGAAWG